MCLETFGATLILLNRRVERLLSGAKTSLDPEQPPKDLEEVREASQKLAKRDAHGNVFRGGIALNIEAWYLELTPAEHSDFYVNNSNGREGRAARP